jgi:hypothetical protein
MFKIPDQIAVKIQDQVQHQILIKIKVQAHNLILTMVFLLLVVSFYYASLL